MDYNEFCNKYEHFARDLCLLGQEAGAELKMPEEDPLYNAGVMSRYMDGQIASNITLVNGQQVKNGFESVKKAYPEMSDDELRARLVFMVLQARGSDLSYEKNGNDVLFGDVTRSQFYAVQVFNDIVSNTNYSAKHIGNMQLVSLEDKGDAMPRKTEDCRNFVAHIPEEERQEIFLKRGLYHESVHAALGTDDERKCDVFALLKVMKEHPKYAKEVFEVYNYQRSQVNHTINEVHKAKNIDDIVKNGTMTYVMPNTYAALRQYAEHPERIPATDKDILKLTYEMTSKPEFSHGELQEFVDAVRKEPMDKKALAATAVMRACREQGEKMSRYIAAEKMMAVQRQVGGR